MPDFKVLRVLGAVLCLALGATPALAIPGIGESIGLSPFWNYKTIETEHFRITFPNELHDTAEKTANYLEEAHSILSPVLYWKASYRVNVLVIDNQDSENGLTSATLRFGMALFVTPPDNWTSIAYYDNWLRELCLHEYTHFLNMDATRELYVPLRYLVGDLLLPNSLWPSWMLEGLAVYDESRYTGAGRGRSPYYDMVLRASVLENVLNTRSFVTLDKINGTNPWYPGGETAYLFGYELMNQAAKESKAGPTADHVGSLTSGEDVLGVMSERSSFRIPFFINGNLENISGKDWYGFWNDFVQKSRTHASDQLQTIHSAPVTLFKRLTFDGYEVYGPAISPDGKWIAFTQLGLNDIAGLYLRNRKTGDTTRILDKSGGVTLSFTSDSRYLFESRLHRIGSYYLYSDLEVLNLEDGSTHWLTWNQRARDPSLSPDNRQIAFTRTEDTKTDLILGKLGRDGEEFSMSGTRVLFTAKKYDRVSTPKFSPDGSRIAFSVHRNGHAGEDLMLADLKQDRVSTLVSDGALNRYPAWDKEGHLYYVSDKTGVDNLYRAGQGQLTNMETGIAFPEFSPTFAKGHFLATVFSTNGWDLAEAELTPTVYESAKLTVAPPDAPVKDEKSVDHAENRNYAVEDYSIWPTILPRTWSPLLQISNQGVYAGGEITGFDQVDRHRYILLGAYDSYVKKGDFYGVYDNRLLGVTLEGAANVYTAWEQTNNTTLIAYGRKQSYSASAYYPFAYTYSTLTPRVSYNFEREMDYAVNPSGGSDINYFKTALVPNADAALTFSNLESSRLAVVSERGRITTGGARVYMNSGENIWKGLFADYEHIELGNTHAVFLPTFKGSWVSHLSRYSPSNVLVQGRQSGLINTLTGDGFDHLGIRGYPLQAYYTRAAAVAAGDFDFPIWRIFGGPGTDPLFFRNFYGFGFGEATYFPDHDVGEVILPSAGGGLKLDVDVAQYVPVEMRVEYDKGFRYQVGGKGEVYFMLGVQATY